MKQRMWKRILASLLAVACVNVAPISGDETAQAATSAPVTVEKDGDSITIGNSFISREFSVAGGKLVTENITNKRTDNGPTVFEPADGSEEFIVKLTKYQHPGIDRSEWTATASSYEKATGASDGNAPNLIDGNVGSIWHTNYGGGQGNQSFPHYVTFDLKKETKFKAFSYTPRQETSTENGNIKDYELFISNEDEAPTDDSGWQSIKSGTFQYDGRNTIYVNLGQEYTAKHVKLVAKNAKNGANFAGGAEFNLHADEYTPASNDDRDFASSELTLSGEPEVKATTATINKKQKSGQMITFSFEPFEYQGVDFTINQVVVMYDGDHFMRKYLEISIPEEKYNHIAIDYIDLESLKVNDSDKTWTIPTDAGGIVQMSRFKANLGQPIYIQGMFLGCEFPAADTEIVDGVGYMRYYTGKNFSQLKRDNQLTTNNKYMTWQTVAGAARSTENQVIQADFFEYIDSIATPSEFRIQYNSWFDNMMYISDQNILDSFIEIDREFNKTEIRPIDSYVVDDGWINYNITEEQADGVANTQQEIDGELDRARRAGTTKNEEGFWAFNDKFPQKLTPSSELVHNFGSNFGVWVGPRGGYNFYGDLATIIETAGKGSKAGGSIDVGSRVYVENLTKMFIQFQEDYGVNYWKWDGFADNAQYGAFGAADGVPGYANDHMTGGYEHMYHVTDLWEAWIDLMETVRKKGEEQGIKNLWFSLTCYVNPSPWFLQWANSVWLQCTHDQGDSGSSSSKMDKQITYRDAAYYDFLQEHEFQFPLANIYNHDPVYGKEGTGMGLTSATDEQFQNYLYMLSTRGTSFWELYYSDSIMTEGKYEVTAEFLAWAEENFHILRNAKMFGASPESSVKLSGKGNNNGTRGAYGFSCFDKSEGIISVRNADTAEQTVTFTFDRTIGVPESATELQYYMEHSHNLTKGVAENGTFEYGNEYSFTLQPDEVRIFRISENGDTEAPKLTRTFFDDKNELIVRFDEKIKNGQFKVNGQPAIAELSADDITYHVWVDEASLTDNQKVSIEVTGLTDISGNELADTTYEVVYHTSRVVAEKSGEIAAETEVAPANESLTGINGFSVSATVNTSGKGTLVKQGSEYELGIDDAGKAFFKLQDATATSKEPVNDGEAHEITGVKENNGILKLYVDGELVASGYDEDNRYYDVKAATITTGIAGVQSAAVYDIAYGYDKVKELFTSGKVEEEVELINVALRKPATLGWNPNADRTDSQEKGDKPASNAVDGNTGTNSYAEFGKDNVDASSYLQVDLEASYELEHLQLYRYHEDGRTYDATVVALSEDENFTEPIIVYNSDKDNKHGFTNEENPAKDDLYAESNKGITIDLNSEEPVKARYIRVYMHGRHENETTTNHLVELEAYAVGTGVRKVALNEKDVLLQTTAGKNTVTLNALVFPANAEGKEITWSTSDAQKATVNNGVVTAVAEGNVTIKATSANGMEAVCNITICNHTNTTRKNVKEATTTQKGYTGDEVCNTCKTLLEVGEFLPKLQEEEHEHAPSTEWQKSDTHHWKVCTGDCGEELEKAEHDWDEGEITTPPTATEKGEKTFTCTVCQATKTEPVDEVTGEGGDQGGEGNEDDNKPHTPSTEWSKDETHHWNACTEAGCEEKHNVAAHSWNNGTVTKQPTATAAGEKTFTCTVCQATKTEVVPATGATGGDNNKPQPVNKTELSTLIQQSSSLKASDYTADTWAAYQTALANVQKVVSNAAATQAEVDAAKVALENAKKALKVVATQQVPTPEPTPVKKGDVIESKDGIYKYKVVNAKEVQFAGVTKSIKTVKIANTVTYNGQALKVTSIANNALKGDKMVTKVVLGTNVKTVGNSAFENCAKLSKVTLKNAVTKIGNKAFKGCTALKKVSIPKNVTTIGKSAFEGCKNLATITIKATNLKKVQGKAFRGIKATAKIKVPKKNLAKYKKLLKNKGQSKKVSIR